MDGERATLEGFLDKYSPEIAREGRLLLERLEARIPGATILVYDNYNALAIGFGASDRASDAILSIALYPSWINLFFLNGASLDDPNGLLKGEGARVRHIQRVTAEDLGDPRVEALIEQALANATPPIDCSAAGAMVIKSISKKQRSRRPA
jgi:hypothetical protein